MGRKLCHNQNKLITKKSNPMIIQSSFTFLVLIFFCFLRIFFTKRRDFKWGSRQRQWSPCFTQTSPTRSFSLKLPFLVKRKFAYLTNAMEHCDIFKIYLKSIIRQSLKHPNIQCNFNYFINQTVQNAMICVRHLQASKIAFPCLFISHIVFFSSHGHSYFIPRLIG